MNPFIRTLWWRAIIILLSAACAYFCWWSLTWLLKTPPLTEEFTTNVTRAVLPIIFLLVGFFTIMTLRSVQYVWPRFCILLITILSFYAFGLDVVQKDEASHLTFHLDIPELATILVLFLLAELAVHLTHQTETVANANKEMQAKVEQLAKAMTEEEFLQALTSLAAIAPILGDVWKLKEWGLSNAVLEHVSQRNTKTWVQTIETALTVPRRDADTKYHQMLWNVLMRSYFAEEHLDLTHKEQINNVPFVVPQIATNQKLYATLLRQIAENSSSHRGDRKVVFFAITHILPEYWFNWKHEDGRYSFPGIDDYRNEVTKLIARSKPTELVYRRLCLIAEPLPTSGSLEPPTNHHGFFRRDQLLAQHELILLSIGEAPRENSAPGNNDFDPPNRADMIQWFKNNFFAIRSFMQLAEGRSAYLILTEQEFTEHIQPKVTDFQEVNLKPGLWTGKLAIETTHLTIYKEKLVDKFISRLHTSADDATAGRVLPGAIENRPLAMDHDILMVGFEPIGAPADTHPDWQFALATNLRPGHETMLLHIVFHKEILEMLWAFTKDGSKIKTAPLASKEAITANL